MKLKQQPDDFRVEELTDVTPGDTGVFAFYRMDKTDWATPDALAAVRRRWKIDLRRLTYGGLKDKHAATTQYLSIHNGPARDLEHHTVKVTYLGRIAHPYESHHIRANRFAVTLRKAPAEAVAAIDALIPSLASQGVPAYFDDQRFGSVAPADGEFIARHMVRGDFESALKLALAAPYAFDKADIRAEKETLLKLWGDWVACKDALPRSHARSLVDYLRTHPTDFKGAVARLRPELRGLYLSAYQSHVWNRMLSRWIERNSTPEQRRMVKLRLGEVPFHVNLDAEAFDRLKALSLPLPSSRWKPPEDHPLLPLVTEVLAEEGFDLKDMQIRGIRELFFSKGERSALCLADNLAHEWADDERNKGHRKLVLRFDLPRGMYATLLVKAVSAAAGES